MIKNSLLSVVLVLLVCSFSAGQEIDSLQLQIDEIEQNLVYETGIIELELGNARLTVPKGFRYLDRPQSAYVLTDLWGNPEDQSVLGMIVPDNRGVLADNSYAFIISFEEMGFVKDDDADDIDYDELLEEMQQETADANPHRIELGYEPIAFIGWASAPYYDKDLKTLHWAKELQFGDISPNTLNYNLRILGRKGIYNLNAVASMTELAEVQSEIVKIIRCVEYTDGHRYADYIPDVDNVAAWTVGGLVAGKILTKVGFFAVILKFWKIIALAFAGAASGFWSFLKARKKKAELGPSDDAS